MKRNKRLSNLKAKWRELAAQRSMLDYEESAILHEVRAMHTRGKRGDEEFVAWCVGNLEVGFQTAGKFLRAAKLYPKYDKATWKKLGGYQSIQLLGNLSAPEAGGVLAVCLMKAKNRSRPLTYAIVRNVLYSLGLEPMGLGGRPTRFEAEEKLSKLRGWARTITASYDLPVPREIKAIISKGTILSQAADKLKERAG